MSTPSLSAVLADAADLLAEHGLSRGRRHGPGKAHSIEGAIEHAIERTVGPIRDHVGLLSRACAAASEQLPPGWRLEEWGDVAEEADVVDLLRRAARAERLRARDARRQSREPLVAGGPPPMF